VKNPEPAAIIPSSPLGGVPGVGSPELTTAVAMSQPLALTTLKVVNLQNTEDTPNCNLAPHQEREALIQTNIRGPKTDAHPRKKSRRAKGKGGSKATEARTEEGRENAPPQAARENGPAHRGRAHRRSGRAEISTRPASNRGRPRYRTNGRDAGRSTGGPDGGVAEVDRIRDHIKAKGRAPLTSHARDDNHDGPSILGSDRQLVSAIVGNISMMPKTDKANSDGDHRKSVPTSTPPIYQNATASSPDEAIEKPLVSNLEGNLSTVQPLPSSTRRRAKEYFQRRTRERSADAAGNHTRPSLRSATVTLQGIKSNVEVPRSQLDLKADIAKCPEKPSKSVSKGKPDQFIFDPEASPFTPNATSSPKQASLSSIGMQSFSSPTPLPSRGNNKVAPLILTKPANRNIPLEMQSDSVPQQLISATSQDIHCARGLAYTHSAANQAQAHLEAEQLALLRLQAYYNWLAGKFPAAGVGPGAGAEEQMDMSGGGGGLGGGVALGRPIQNRGRGKMQCRNSGGAYAHPKEHVVFSPRDHERMEVASPLVPQKDREQTGFIHPGKDGADEKLKGEARRPSQKWDGKWGLREMSTPGKEVGWKWGGIGTAGSAQVKLLATEEPMNESG
jgi:hypothetical protein